MRKTFSEHWQRYWFAPVPPERLEVLGLIIYAFIIGNIALSGWINAHAWAPKNMYRPVLLGRLLGIPGPNAFTMIAVVSMIVIACCYSIWRRNGRVAPKLVLFGYGLWLLWAFSYGKVDHDRLTILVALGVLAFRPGQHADYGRRAGYASWALRLIQVVFAITYPLSAWGKIHFGGIDWANGNVFVTAILRKGTVFGNLFLSVPWLLVIAQWVFISFEVFALALLLPRGKLRSVALVGVIVLHVTTYALIGIHFLPHLICIGAFFPLERLSSRYRSRSGLRARRALGDGVSTLPEKAGAAS